MYLKLLLHFRSAGTPSEGRKRKKVMDEIDIHTIKLIVEGIYSKQKSVFKIVASLSFGGYTIRGQEEKKGNGRNSYFYNKIDIYRFTIKKSEFKIIASNFIWWKHHPGLCSSCEFANYHTIIKHQLGINKQLQMGIHILSLKKSLL